MIILGIDPGTTSVGYAVLEGRERGCRLLSADLIRIHTSSPCERLKELSAGVNSLINEWSPGALATERLFFAKNQKTALRVAEARGAILLTAALAELMVYEYTPLEIKRAVTGDGTADKLQLQKMMRLSFPEIAGLRARDDVFDAAGIALTCWLQDIRSGATTRSIQEIS
ncbi:MAG: crossover junction endodeoxyribonuclease RuvC [Candidatus Sungbacteria bacterium]|nr:crossover junction endodeoxyribonuclease RuvC [Candidatus Sungbacteria bacterium]